MRFLNKTFFKRAIIFVSINTIIGFIISGFLHPGRYYSFTSILLMYQTLTHITAITAAAVWLIASHVLTLKNQTLKQIIVFPLTIGASVGGLFLGLEVVIIFFYVDLSRILYFPSRVLMPAIAITLLYLLINRIVQKIQHTSKTFVEIHPSPSSAESNDIPYFSVKTGDRRHKIKHSDIVYLSSNGRNSIIHTCGEDHLIHQKLGDMTKLLPVKSFIRIHKRFIVNVHYISRLQYYKGGRYNLFLTDEDENILPVGKQYTPEVKSFIKD